MPAKKRYRYITCVDTNLDDPVSKFRLIGGSNMFPSSGWGTIRIEIPDDMVLEKWNCDPYSTTEDTRKIKDLNPCVSVRINGRRVIRNDLLEHTKNDYSTILRNEGYRLTNEGYTKKSYEPRK